MRSREWRREIDGPSDDGRCRFTGTRLALGFGAMLLFVASGVAVRAGSLAGQRFVVIAVLSAALWLLALQPFLRKRPPLKGE